MAVKKVFGLFFFLHLNFFLNYILFLMNMYDKFSLEDEMLRKYGAWSRVIFSDW